MPQRDWMQFKLAPTLIAEGSRLQGSLTFVSLAQIHGVVEGNVVQTALETLQVGPKGWIQGNIESKGPVIVEGRTDGDIRSETSIQLLPSANVSGLLKAPVVRIAPGAMLHGEIEMLGRVRSLSRRAATTG